MKKFSKLLLLSIMVLGLSGCLKYDVSMSIANDKSMDFEMIAAMNMSMLKSLGDGSSSSSSTTESFDKSDYKEYEKAGYKVEEYKEKKDDAEYEGVKISKKFANIDDVSTNKDEAVEFTKLFDENAKPEDVHFFYKNGDVYKANLTFNLVDDNSNSSDNTDYSQYQSYFDLEYKVTLPEKPISNNATSVSEDGKTLTWKMKYGEKNSIQYEFRTSKEKATSKEKNDSNNKFIYIAGGVVAVVVIAVVVASFTQKKNNNPTNNTPTNN